MMSPERNPAAAAGDPSMVPPTSAPRVAFDDDSSGWTSSPSQARRTRPSRMRASATSRARSAGIAPARPRLISLTPTISPFMLTSGPPELPPKIAASWPIQRTIEPTSSPSSVIRLNGQNMPGMIISVLLTIPIVTDCDSASGLPSASTRSPTCSEPTSPKLATGNFRGAAGFSFSTAMSDSGSVPTSSAGISSRLASVQTMARVRPATWWLVTTWPSAEMMVPLPDDSRFSSRPSTGTRSRPRGREPGWARRVPAPPRPRPANRARTGRTRTRRPRRGRPSRAIGAWTDVIPDGADALVRRICRGNLLSIATRVPMAVCPHGQP